MINQRRLRSPPVVASTTLSLTTSKLVANYSAKANSENASRLSLSIRSVLSKHPPRFVSSIHLHSEIDCGNAQKLNAATSVSKGKAKLALSLVGHDSEVSAAMTFVFGDTLICDDAESAKTVTFHPQVGLRSVTTQGDVYDPSGTISGGSAPSSSGLLVKVQELKRAEAALQEAKDELRRLEHKEQSGKVARDAWTKAKRDLEMKQHEVKLLEEQVAGSNAAMARTSSSD